MVMQPRQSTIDLFSTFLRFEADCFSNWAIDSKLRRSMKVCLAKVSESKASEQFWTTYWHQRWREQHSPSQAADLRSSRTQQASEEALGHLSAYLQEACYWSAYKAANWLTASRYGIADCFQIAIAEVPKILRARDPNHPASLKTYASQAFKNSIRDFLRQSREVDLCSDWGLLLKLSRKQLTEALLQAGLSAAAIEQHLLAWTCFETVYLPTKSPGLRQLPAPDRETWSAIATLYNQQRHQLKAASAACGAEMIAGWLSNCTRRARAYLYPPVASLNAPKPGFESKEWQDDLANDDSGLSLDENDESLLSALIAQEEAEARQTQQRDVNEVLKTAIATLNPEAQELLTLYYQHELTQQQVAKQLNVQQYTISRKLSKVRADLLLALTRWSQETLHIAPSSDVVKNISVVLEEWLQQSMK